MDVETALRTRYSCRAFTDKPVPEKTIRAILAAAAQAPSGGNLQPWHVHALTGAPLTALLDDIRRRPDLLPDGEGAEYTVYPSPLKEPYRSRRFTCGMQLYGALGIERDDRAARMQQFGRNFELFGAPVGLFFTVDRQMGPPQWSDLGMFIQSIMLAACANGLDTCAQEAWSIWPKTLKVHLGLDDHIMVFCGMALGFGDPDHPANSWRTERAEIEDFARFSGFA